MKQTVALLIVLFFLVACTSPLDKKFNEQTLKEDIQEIKESGELDSLESQMLAAYLLRGKMRSEDMSKMTYREMVDAVKAERKKNEEARIKEEAEEAARQKRLAGLVSVELIDKGYRTVDYQDFITLNYRIINLSGKAIRAIKGVVEHNDLFDENVYNVRFTFDEEIAPGDSLIWYGTLDYNQFDDDLRMFRSKELNNIKIVWSPEKIMFSDGSTLE